MHIYNLSSFSVVIHTMRNNVLLGFTNCSPASWMFEISVRDCSNVGQCRYTTECIYEMSRNGARNCSWSYKRVVELREHGVTSKKSGPCGISIKKGVNDEVSEKEGIKSKSVGGPQKSCKTRYTWRECSVAVALLRRRSTRRKASIRRR